jgi:thiamine-phosphate pyrophosphorylase
MLFSKFKDQVIDVNLNRLSEGLRIIEETTRFYFKDQKKLAIIRKLKQELWQNFSETRKKAIWARKSEHDLGRDASFDIHKRGNLVDMLTANFKRCQEAARVLEEIFKISNPTQAKFFKNLRFIIYDLEKDLLKRILPEFNPRFYVILDIGTIGRKRLIEITKSCIAGGATMLQLREPKDTMTKQWLSDAKKIKTAITNTKVKFIINDRADVAMAINADGTHIGKDDIPIDDTQRLLGDEMIIGVTVRNVKEAIVAEKKGATYIGVGAIFPSPSKPSASVVGINTLKEIVNSVKIPVIAIGGITRNNAKNVLKTGASGIAIISSVFKGIDFSKKGFGKKIMENLKKIQ